MKELQQDSHSYAVAAECHLGLDSPLQRYFKAMCSESV